MLNVKLIIESRCFWFIISLSQKLSLLYLITLYIKTLCEVTEDIKNIQTKTVFKLIKQRDDVCAFTKANIPEKLLCHVYSTVRVYNNLSKVLLPFNIVDL